MWYQDWFNEDYLKLYADRDSAEAEGHIDFILKQTGLHGGKVLDLGCGGGRHSALLAEKGFDVTGIDQSKVLIEKAHETSELPTWIHGNFLTHPFQQRFNLIISMFTSFGYEDDDAKNSHLFSRVSKLLLPNGRFFFDYLSPEHVRASLVPYEEVEVEGEKVIVERSIQDDIVTKTIRFPAQTYHERVKLYDTRALERMVSTNGLQVVAKWGGYPPDGNDRQLFLISL